MAEARFYPRYHRRLRSIDYVCAFGLARYLTGWGAREFIRYQERETKKLLNLYWDDVKHVALALLEYDELNEIAVKGIMNREAMAPEESDPF